VYLDLDGVVVDWNADFTRLAYGRVLPLPTDYEYACYINRYMTIQQVHATPGFWEGLKPLPVGQGMIQYVLSNTACDLFFLTKGCNYYEEKQAWLKKYYPMQAKKLIMATHKELLADPESLLVDDYYVNVLNWKNAGGKALLTPSPYDGRPREAYTWVDFWQDFKTYTQEPQKWN
jgi:5'(3')-deoxyribonucleotidase